MQESRAQIPYRIVPYFRQREEGNIRSPESNIGGYGGDLHPHLLEIVVGECRRRFVVISGNVEVGPGRGLIGKQQLVYPLIVLRRPGRFRRHKGYGLPSRRRLLTRNGMDTTRCGYSTWRPQPP